MPKITAKWSEIPGTTQTESTRVRLFVKKRSKMLLSCQFLNHLGEAVVIESGNKVMIHFKMRTIGFDYGGIILPGQLWEVEVP